MAYYEDIAIMPNNFLKCVLCDEIMENNDRLIESHIDSRQHREQYMRRLMSHNSIITRSTEPFCQLCNHDVNIAELTHHVQSALHSKNLSSLIELIENDGKFIQIPDKNNCIYCCICNSQINFTLELVKSHLESAKHKRARAMVLQPLNGIFSVEGNDDYLWCKLCQIFFDNYVELIFQHIEESEHAKTMRKILRLIDGENITIDNYLQSPKQDKAFCKKCSIEVPCNVDNLQRHINGKKHDTDIKST